MRPLFIIPARGGSKGIPGKNIKPLAGKPLILYSLEVALQLADREDICVTTDSDEIIKEVEIAGQQVRFKRPAELATDTSGSYEVMLHALNQYDPDGIVYDTIVLLQPTSLLRTAKQVSEAMGAFQEGDDMVVSVVEASCNPYYNCFEDDAEGLLHISKGDGRITRRQEAPKAWEYNGAIYVISAEALRRGPLGTFKRVRKYVMDKESSIDLDTPLDWRIAEMIIAERR